ncbi:MAG TPA: glycosyltransferase family 2 protein [Thermoplasmata archaeon]|nr:glycosyltransferase family 2 protein [Thermoplasmata archaeon]
MRATLVIPTLNEAASIGHVLRTFQRAAEAANPVLFPQDPLDWEVLVVDGRSADGTADIAADLGARVILEARKGYGRAYRTGFAEASGEVLATLDGDATYPSEEVPRLVRYLLDRDLDFLTCDRLASLDPKAMTFEHRIGNRLLNLFMRLAYHGYFRAAGLSTIRDSQSGMWVFRRSVLSKVSLTQDGMPMSEELKLEVVLRGLRFEEVPIAYAERWGAPKLSSWRDGRQNLEFLLTKRLAIHRQGLRPGAPRARPPGVAPR